MAINVPALVILVILYLVILIVGVVAAKKFKSKSAKNKTELNVLAGRDLGGIVGIFTMTATTVGGGYINGTAESVYKDGLIWTLAPFGIFIGLIIAGLFYAKKMRDEKYLTMLDPFQHRYGNTMVGLLYLAAICGDLFWSASILSALGTSLSVIVNLNQTISIVISACIAVLYTIFGQMVAVAYTDVAQMMFIGFGLILCVPFALTNELVEPITSTTERWYGTWYPPTTAVWIDLAITMTFGTIPWQTYFQRVLSVKSSQHAQRLTFVAACGASLMAIPPILIGAVGTSANWTMTELGESPMSLNQSSLVLPLVLQHFTPTVISAIGLGAVAAAVMSSTDSAILSSSSMFTYNIYNKLAREKASDKELEWVQRIAVFFVGAIATVMSLFIPSIYGMFILAADIVFVVMFPQLTTILYFKFTNTYGAISGYVIGLLLRLGGGESFIGLPPFIYYPYYSETDGQLFPFRTFSMLVSMTTILLVSYFTQVLFIRGVLPAKVDIFRSYSTKQMNGDYFITCCDPKENKQEKDRIIHDVTSL